MKRYVIDSSSLMKFEDQFPKDILPSLWDEVYKLFEEGKLFSVRAVYEELEDSKDILKLFNWREYSFDSIRAKAKALSSV